MRDPRSWLQLATAAFEIEVVASIPLRLRFAGSSGERLHPSRGKETAPCSSQHVLLTAGPTPAFTPNEEMHRLVLLREACLEPPSRPITPKMKCGILRPVPEAPAP